MKRIFILILLFMAFFLSAQDKTLESETIAHFENSTIETGLCYEDEAFPYEGSETYLLTFNSDGNILVLDAKHNSFYEYSFDEGFISYIKLDIQRVPIIGDSLLLNEDGNYEIYSKRMPHYYQFNADLELSVACLLDFLNGEFGLTYESEADAVTYANDTVFFWIKDDSFVCIPNPVSDYVENNRNIFGAEETRALLESGTEFSLNGFELVGDDYLLSNGELVTNSYNHFIHYQKFIEPDYSRLSGHVYGYFNPDYSSYICIGTDNDGNRYYKEGARFLIFNSNNFCIERFSVEYENYYNSSTFIDDTGNIYWMEYTPYTEGSEELTRGPSNSKPEIVGVDYYIKKITRTWGLPEQAQTIGE